MPTGLVVAPLSLSRSTCVLESRITLYRTARELTLQTFVKSGGSHEPHLQAKVDLALVRKTTGCLGQIIYVCVSYGIPYIRAHASGSYPTPAVSNMSLIS